MREHPHYQDIVLIGGGHSHAILLQLWAKNPLPGVRLTLVSPQVQSAYAGMLPGMIAGHYGFSDIHIDLPRLCRAAGARFIQACAHQIDPAERRVSLLGRPDLEFDLLSLDIGATPCRNIPGSELAIPVKPVGHFHRYWQQLRQQVHSKHEPLRLGVVGGGLGGCELAMAISWALEEPVYSGRVEIHLLHAGNKLPEDYPLLTRRLMAREFNRLKIHPHRNWRVAEITHRGVHNDEGKFLPLDKVLLCTEAGAPPWLTQSGLALDEQGFVLVDEYLRAEQHPYIFAAGDVVSPTRVAGEKAASSALQQGPALYHNLRATLLEQPLKPYRPRNNALRLVTCGSHRAIACRGGLAAVGGPLWHWKDHRERNFMARFNALPVGARPATSFLHRVFQPRTVGLEQRNNISVAGLQGGGTGARISNDILERTLARLPSQPNTAQPPKNGDHPPTLQLPAGQWLVQRSEQLRAPVSDPWLFGRLAALHTLTDILAAHAKPVAAQALVTLPTSAPELATRDLQQILDGVVRELHQHQCTLSGGHTFEGNELQLGLTVSGAAERQKMVGKSGLRAGDCLILSKPIGTGVLLAAERHGKARGRWLQQALEMMLQSNATAAEIFAGHQASVVSGIGGFGLLGHLLEMLHWRSDRVSPHFEKLASAEAPELGASLFADALPLLPGATYCAERGLLSSLHQHNTRTYAALQNPTAWRAEPLLPLLVDPQICGGLLASVPSEFTENCLAALHAAGCRHASVIGFVDELPESREQLPYAPQPVHLTQSGDWKKMASRYTEVIS